MLRRTLCYPGSITSFVDPDEWNRAALNDADKALVGEAGMFPSWE